MICYWYTCQLIMLVPRFEAWLAGSNPVAAAIKPKEKKAEQTGLEDMKMRFHQKAANAFAAIGCFPGKMLRGAYRKILAKWRSMFFTKIIVRSRDIDQLKVLLLQRVGGKNEWTAFKLIIVVDGYYTIVLRKKTNREVDAGMLVHESIELIATGFSRVKSKIDRDSRSALESSGEITI